MPEKKNKKVIEKKGSIETGLLFRTTNAAQILTRGNGNCDVCGKSMFDDERNECVALHIEVSNHPEADRVLEIFGKQTFNICFVCFLRALGVKELND